MEVTIRKLEPLYPAEPQPKDPDDEEMRKSYRKRSSDHEAFKVVIGSHKILTVFTSSEKVMRKWVCDVQKAYQNKKQHLIVGFCADRDLHYGKKGEKGNPYDILTLCIGSHCLIYDLKDNIFDRPKPLVPRSLRDFFADRNAIFVGFRIGEVLEKLEKDHELESAWKVDVRAIARNVTVKGHPHFTGISSAKYDSIDLAAKMLLDMEVNQQKRWVKHKEWWYDCRREWCDKSMNINMDYVKDLTVDAFFCYQIGVKYSDVTYHLSRKKYNYF